MPYTLTKGLLWFLLALLIGVVIGWLLRSIRATSQLRGARATRHDSAELERLRGRVANPEPAVAERDRLLAELASRDRLSAAPAGPADPPPPADPADGSLVTESVAPADVVVLAPGKAAASREATVPATDDAAEPAATRVLGRRIERDDLTVIEGVSPAIAALCHGIGITRWAEMADTEPSLLRTMLADAGPSLVAHHADTWPAQARLLASGRWEEFQSLVATLDHGKLGE